MMSYLWSPDCYNYHIRHLRLTWFRLLQFELVRIVVL